MQPFFQDAQYNLERHLPIFQVQSNHKKADAFRRARKLRKGETGTLAGTQTELLLY